MKSLLGILAGALIAITIGCAAKTKAPPSAPSQTAAEPTAAGAMPQPGASRTRAEIDALDAAITDEMSKLALARPEPPPLTCTGDTCAQQMSGAAVAATSPSPPTCKPAQTQTCTDACQLKDSICKNAGSICRIASELGGRDAYANDKCNQGTASCEAAKTRCCSCM